jgi:hypothetical protein
MTMVLGSEMPLHSSTFAPMFCASARPPFPVTALAQPLLMTTERTPCPLRWFSVDLLTCTGAAWNLFVVNTAAAAQGSSDEIKARSGYFVFDALTPTWVPETRNPLGYVPEEGMCFLLGSGMVVSWRMLYRRIWPRRGAPMKQVTGPNDPAALDRATIVLSGLDEVLCWIENVVFNGVVCQVKYESPHLTLETEYLSNTGQGTR